MKDLSATLTAREIATYENVSIDTVRRAIHGEFLKAHKVGKRGDWRIKWGDFEAWVEGGALTPSQTKKEDAVSA